MTGFGIGNAPLGEGRLAVELRALNHRYVEVRTRLPTELTGESFFLEQLARQAFARGRYDVSVRVEGDVARPGQIDVHRARAVYESLAALRDELAPGEALSVSAVLAAPGVLAEGIGVDSTAAREAMGIAFKRAIEALSNMRNSEGSALQVELEGRLTDARSILDRIRQRAPDLAARYRQRLAERVARLLADTEAQLEVGRLEMEVALLADKSDVTEEVVRLSSHFSQFEKLMRESDPIGRRLDFLLQEMGREINTIGAKSQDTDVSSQVVELKAQIERMREQVQNVE